MDCQIELTLPSLSPTRFVEYKRSFVVRGIIKAEKILPDDLKLSIALFDIKGNLLRFVSTNQKNGPMYLNHPKLVTYPKNMDVDRKKLEAFGFASLAIDDKDRPLDSLHKASNKCWYSETKFEGIIISASNTETGALFDDGLNLVDDCGKPYNLLPIGKYKLVVELKGKGIDIRKEEMIEIGRRKEQIICRFNPEIHHQRMLKWCEDNDYVIIKDTLPGYLESYLGVWLYHMGLKQMYHANDLPLYENQNIRIFVYLLDVDSTSYRNELSFVQKQQLFEKGKVKSYHYDIGEAVVLGRQAQIIEFKEDEDLYLCRVDIVNEKAKEDIYYLDESGLVKSIFALENIIVEANTNIAFMGIIKPYQQSETDFELIEDNNYLIKNYPKKIKYRFIIDEKEYLFEHYFLMERIDNVSIGKSVYEFYNIIHIDTNWQNKDVDVSITCFDVIGAQISKEKKIIIKVRG